MWILPRPIRRRDFFISTQVRGRYEYRVSHRVFTGFEPGLNRVGIGLGSLPFSPIPSVEPATRCVAVASYPSRDHYPRRPANFPRLTVDDYEFLVGPYLLKGGGETVARLFPFYFFLVFFFLRLPVKRKQTVLFFSSFNFLSLLCCCFLVAARKKKETAARVDGAAKGGGGGGIEGDSQTVL